MSVKQGIYQHFKGNYYAVIGMAGHSETQVPHVLYKALYGEMGLWVRPATMFIEDIEREGKTFARFAWVSDQTAEDFLANGLKKTI